MSLTEAQHDAAFPAVMPYASAGGVVPNIEIKLSFFMDGAVKRIVISVPSSERHGVAVTMDDSDIGNFKWGITYIDAEGRLRIVEEREDFENNKAAQILLMNLYQNEENLFGPANFLISGERVITARIPWNPEHSLTSGKPVIGLSQQPELV